MNDSYPPGGTIPHRLVRYGFAYILWLVTIVLAVLTALALRDTFRLVLISLRLQRYTIYVDSQIVTLLLGFVLVLLVIIVEHLYRTAVPKGLLIVRALLVGGWLFLLLALVHGTHIALVYWSNGVGDRLRLMVAGIELAIGIVFLWVRIRLYRSRITNR